MPHHTTALLILHLLLLAGWLAFASTRRKAADPTIWLGAVGLMMGVILILTFGGWRHIGFFVPRFSLIVGLCWAACLGLAFHGRGFWAHLGQAFGSAGAWFFGCYLGLLGYLSLDHGNPMPPTLSAYVLFIGVVLLFTPILAAHEKRRWAVPTAFFFSLAATTLGLFA